MEITLNLNAESPEARRANELARELVTSRAFSGKNGDTLELFTGSLQRVVSELLEGPTVDQRLAERVAYLLGALSIVGAAAVWAAAKGFEAVEAGDAEKTSPDAIPEEHIQRVLVLIAQYMATGRSGL